MKRLNNIIYGATMEVFKVLFQKSFFVNLRKTFLFFPNALLIFLCQTACCAALPNSSNVFTAPTTTVIIHKILVIVFDCLCILGTL